MTTPSTGYKDNKDEHGVEEARVRRMQDAQKMKKKRDLATQLSAIKNFLFSTKSMIDAKKPILKQKEIQEKSLKIEIGILETKEKTVEAKIEKSKFEKESFSVSDTQKSSIAGHSLQEKRRLENEIRELMHQIDVKKALLAGMNIEKTKHDATLNHKNLEAKTHEIIVSQTEAEKLKRETEKKKHDLATIEHEEEELQRQITQLITDKVKLENDIKKTEAEIIRSQ